MKLTDIIIVNTLYVCCLSILLKQTPCTAVQVEDHSLHEQASDDYKFIVPALPRKLRLLEDATAKDYGGQSSIHNKRKGHSPEKTYQKEQSFMRGSKGTWREWVEDATVEKSQFFTMDYSNVRRRRPIHNKSLPVGP